MKKSIPLILLLIATMSGAQSSIQSTKHNLSASGPGPIKSLTEKEVCKFCHVPHNSGFQAPLWNRADPGGTYRMYWSPTLNAYGSPASAPRPDGASKLCLSCHDGTIALGSTVASGVISMSGGITTMPTSSPGHLGQDLSSDHPISFSVTESVIAANNASGDVPLKSVTEMREGHLEALDASGKIQCTSCHNPHNNQYGHFLSAPTVDELCLACHF